MCSVKRCGPVSKHATQAHVTNVNDNPARLRRCGWRSSARLAEQETTVAGCYALFNALFWWLVKWAVLGTDSVLLKKRQNPEFGMRLQAYAETISLLYGQKMSSPDGDDTPWSKAFWPCLCLCGLKMRFTRYRDSVQMGQAEGKSMFYLKLATLCLQQSGWSSRTRSRPVKLYRYSCSCSKWYSGSRCWKSDCQHAGLECHQMTKLTH